MAVVRPEDAITLRDIAQTGAEGIVMALHDVSCGVVVIDKLPW